MALKKELPRREKKYYATYAKTPALSQRRKGLSQAEAKMLEAHDKLKAHSF